MKISVVVTVLNEAKTIESLLTSLSQQTCKPDEVAIVDGGSQDETVNLIKKFQQTHKNFPLNVVVQAGNRSVGRNLAMSMARYDWLAITDAGCVPEGDWLEQLAAAARELDRRGELDFVLAGYYQASCQNSFQAAAAPYFLVMPDRVDPDSFLPATRSMLVTRNLWQKAGMFDESLNYNEDYAFAQRLKNLQMQTGQKLIYFVGTAVVNWQPPANLMQFSQVIFRFATGDVQAGIWRIKVGLVFGRYLLLALLLSLAIFHKQNCFLFIFGGGAIYLLWSIGKNYRYAQHTWYWLPILQIFSDWAVMAGSLRGIFLYFNRALSHKRRNRSHRG